MNRRQEEKGKDVGVEGGLRPARERGANTNKSQLHEREKAAGDDKGRLGAQHTGDIIRFPAMFTDSLGGKIHITDWSEAALLFLQTGICCSLD